MGALRMVKDNDAIEVHVYCDDEICSNHGKEMRYSNVKPQEHTLHISSMCVGCLRRVIVTVKL